MRVLVTAASKHGATMGIAEMVATELSAQGLAAQAKPVEDVSSVVEYDAVVLGSAIYFGRWLKSAVAFADVFSADLSSREVWLFSSGPVDEAHTASTPGCDGAGSPIKGTLHPREHRVFPGALDKGRLGVAERSVVRLIRGKYGDYRNWDDIRAWARVIADSLTAPSAGEGRTRDAE